MEESEINGISDQLQPAFIYQSFSKLKVPKCQSSTFSFKGAILKESSLNKNSTEASDKINTNYPPDYNSSYKQNDILFSGHFGLGEASPPKIKVNPFNSLQEEKSNDDDYLSFSQAFYTNHLENNKRKSSFSLICKEIIIDSKNSEENIKSNEEIEIEIIDREIERLKRLKELKEEKIKEKFLKRKRIENLNNSKSNSKDDKGDKGNTNDNSDIDILSRRIGKITIKKKKKRLKDTDNTIKNTKQIPIFSNVNNNSNIELNESKETVSNKTITSIKKRNKHKILIGRPILSVRQAFGITQSKYTILSKSKSYNISQEKYPLPDPYMKKINFISFEELGINSIDENITKTQTQSVKQKQSIIHYKKIKINEENYIPKIF